MTIPTRVLQVVYEMNRGGIETWLMNVLHNIDRERFRFDFLVYTTEPRAYDAEIRELGCQIISCTHPSKTIVHLRHLRRILNSHQPYDVIHAHGSANIGSTLREAAIAKVPIRIAHSHNTSRSVGWRRIRSYFYQPIVSYWLKRHMTHGFGCSELACAHLFGDSWQSDRRCQVLYYGLDWENFQQKADVAAIRTSLGIPDHALVIGHVGRFYPQKNHDFLIEISRHLVNQRNDIYFLLVGDGPLKGEIQEKVYRLGLEDRFIFTGARADINQILHIMDVFLFPSHFEGLGIVLLEAQAVGLPCVTSNLVPPETTVIEELVTRLPLEFSPEKWAKTVLETATTNQYRRDHFSAWQKVANSKFSMGQCLEKLCQVYQEIR
ncbi:MAG: glycosyltransferase family 1 protein [Anaerolineae bacterium]|nr:glycosyltransferase family 1 protein [Anaerolineae bacterium]